MVTVLDDFRISECMICGYVRSRSFSSNADSGRKGQIKMWSGSFMYCKLQDDSYWSHEDEIDGSQNAVELTCLTISVEWG